MKTLLFIPFVQQYLDLSSGFLFRCNKYKLLLAYLDIKIIKKTLHYKLMIMLEMELFVSFC